MMPTAQPAFMSRVSELLQSLGVEITLFAVTLCLAVLFRGAHFGKQIGSSKSPKSPKLRVHRAEERAGDRATCSSNPETTRQPTRCPTLGQAPNHVLSQKVEWMITCASRRQAADAIAILEEIKASGENIAFQEALKCGKHLPVDVFNMLVQCAGRIGRTELIVVFLQDMTSAGIERPLAFYEGTMKMLASKKCYKEAMSATVWRLMVFNHHLSR